MYVYIPKSYVMIEYRSKIENVPERSGITTKEINAKISREHMQTRHNWVSYMRNGTSASRIHPQSERPPSQAYADEQPWPKRPGLHCPR